uniref:Uncharacterized protein n=1 Tax=Arundo donax TaxID=35708 RepID=A0A0A9CKU0_ARUDO
MLRSRKLSRVSRGSTESTVPVSWFAESERYCSAAGRLGMPPERELCLRSSRRSGDEFGNDGMPPVSWLWQMMRLAMDGSEAMDGGMPPEIWLKLTSSVRRLDSAPKPSGIRPEMRFLLTARNRRLEHAARDAGSSPSTRPGTSESSVSADSLPSAASSRPVSPGNPARGSPSASAVTLLPSQNTPGKPHGSAVKSQPSKNADPGMSSSDRRTACSARKSTGSRIPAAGRGTTATAAKTTHAATAPSRAAAAAILAPILCSRAQRRGGSGLASARRNRSKGTDQPRRGSKSAGRWVWEPLRWRALSALFKGERRGVVRRGGCWALASSAFVRGCPREVRK